MSEYVEYVGMYVCIRIDYPAVVCEFGLRLSYLRPCEYVKRWKENVGM
jgi:hypothetical protein